MEKAGASKKELKPAEAERKRLAEVLKQRTAFFGLDKGGFDKYVAVMQHRFRNHISCLQAQKEAARIFRR